MHGIGYVFRTLRLFPFFTVTNSATENLWSCLCPQKRCLCTGRWIHDAKPSVSEGFGTCGHGTFQKGCTHSLHQDRERSVFPHWVLSVFETFASLIGCKGDTLFSFCTCFIATVAERLFMPLYTLHVLLSGQCLSCILFVFQNISLFSYNL